MDPPPSHCRPWISHYGTSPRRPREGLFINCSVQQIGLSVFRLTPACCGTGRLLWWRKTSAAAIARGYSQIKLHEIDERCVAAARRAIGSETPLMIDVNCAWTAEDAIAQARAFSQHNIMWLEEPVWPPEDCAQLEAVKTQSGVSIAAGENAGNLADLFQLVSVGRVDYLQPSVTKVGGISEMLRAAALCDEFNVQMVPHSPYFGPGLIATIHLCASLKNKPHVERFYCDLEASPLGEAIEPIGGAMPLPQKPGLGVDMDEDIIKAYRIQ
jgi:D-galactarolactone cycloisomerase